MSQAELNQIVERLSVDAAFRDAFQRDPQAALRGCALTADERAALLAGDQTRLESLGVDARITKQAIYVPPADPGSFAPGQPG